MKDMIATFARNDLTHIYFSWIFSLCVWLGWVKSLLVRIHSKLTFSTWSLGPSLFQPYSAYETKTPPPGKQDFLTRVAQTMWEQIQNTFELRFVLRFVTDSSPKKSCFPGGDRRWLFCLKSEEEYFSSGPVIGADSKSSPECTIWKKHPKHPQIVSSLHI